MTKGNAAPKHSVSTITVNMVLRAKSRVSLIPMVPVCTLPMGASYLISIVQALRGQDITLYGDGTQTRSFCYVDDLVEGLIRLMDTDAEVTGPVNLGNPEECSVYELAQGIIEKTGSASQLRFHELPQDDPRQRCPDISKARRLLNWESVVPLDEGLTRTIEYFRSHSACSEL